MFTFTLSNGGLGWNLSLNGPSTVSLPASVGGKSAPTKTHPESPTPAPKTASRKRPSESARPQAVSVFWTQDTPVGVASANIAARDAAPPLSIVTWPHTIAWLRRGVQPQAISVHAVPTTNRTITQPTSFMGSSGDPWHAGPCRRAKPAARRSQRQEPL